MQNQDKLDFSDILATSAHDMKNSLFMLLQSIEHLAQDDNLSVTQHQAFADLHYQTSRINGSLMQLLALYRDENKHLPVYIEEHSVAEMLEEVIDKNKIYLNCHHIETCIDVDDALMGYFDQDLVSYLIGDIFVNALRHSKKMITLRAFFKDQYLNIQVEDDGQGYPTHMLAMNNDETSEFNASTGRSGLGLLFAKKIAAEHKTKALQGHILLENRCDTNGSLFTLRLP